MNNDDHTTKICTKCKTEYPRTAEHFRVRKTSRDGLGSWCRFCAQESGRIYGRKRLADPEYRARRREYNNLRRSNPEALAREREQSRQYYSDPQIRERVREYRRGNPLYLAANSRRKARKKGLADNFTNADWQFAIEYFNYKCAVCERLVEEEQVLAADHWIPLSSSNCPGTIPTNILPLCHGKNGCNNSKFNHDAKEWLVERFGESEAACILARIKAYFSSLEDA